MKKKAIVAIMLVCIISSIAIIFIINRNYSNDSKEIETLNEEIFTKEEVVTEVLKTIFTSTYDDSERLKNDGLFELYEERGNKVKPYFTDKGYESIFRTRRVMEFTYIFQEYECECESTVENLELDFRETSNVDEMVCYYQLNFIIKFKDTSIEPYSNLLVGTLSLNKEEYWKINTYTMNSYVSFLTGFNNYIRDLKYK